ncbi:hypothetical protein EMCRGX_G030998 [Ephydatia muelleri]
MDSSGESIKVFVRVRPPDPHLESELDQQECIQVTSDVSMVVHSKPEPKVFTFDSVAGVNSSQGDMFTTAGRPIIDGCVNGYNGTIFAYGQTGSGKTFTMIGPNDESDVFTHDLRGIIPRSFEYLFNLITREQLKCGELVEFLCKCSFLEIYNEQVFDLLDPASVGLHLRENMKRGVYVDGLTEQSISSAKDAYQALSVGWLNRRVASTSMNRESSRSHAVFTITLESKKKDKKDGVPMFKTALLNLVDLAGSERQRDTQAAGVRLKEAGSINKSLSALGNVIMALVDITHGKTRHVHYRDSKLTFLLRDSLGGNARTHLIANIHPSARCFGETLSTLNFARRAKMIQNKAVVNEETGGTILQLQAEVRRLKEALEKYRVGGTPQTAGSPPEATASYMSSSDDQKTIHNLKEMLAASMAVRERTEAEKLALLERVDNLEQLCTKKDKFLQSTKMILKLRETHLAQYEKNKGSALSEDSTIKLLSDEIDQLKYKVDHHPDITKFAMENLDLRAELKKTRAASVGQNDLSKELAKSHQYTLQLEQQLKQYLTQAGSRDSSTPLRAGSALRPSSSPKTTSAEMERLKAKCKQLQTDLDRTKLTLGKNQEEFHIKESKLEASVAAAKKTIHELERTIEGMKLKNNTEKATLNEMHVNTIKSMLTPRWEGLHGNRSTSSTPLRQRLDSESMKDILQAHPTFNTPPKMGPLSPMETAIARDNGAEGKRCTVSVGVNTEVPMCHTPPPPPSLEDLVELNIEGALTDELKILQDTNGRLQREIEELERQVSREAQMKTSLSLQLEELTRLSSSEKDATLEREQLLLDKIAELSSNIASLTGTNAVQSGEILDLRLCLNSADRELTELKEEMKVLKHDQDTRLMEQTQRAADVEEQMGAKISEFERVTEELQCLQDEVDTLREELTFKEHGCRELEQALGREKEHVVSLETEVQSLLDRLAVEVEKSTCLSAELKEGSAEKQQLVATLDDNSRLASELQLLQSRLQNEVQNYELRLREAEASIASLTRRETEGKEAFGALMVQLQELRATSSQHEDRIALSNKELEDSVLEMSRTSARLDEKSAQVEALQKRIAERDAIHEKELKSKDMERDLVGDELDHLTEQYQQISTAFETQTKDLLSAQAEIKRLSEEAANWENEVRKLQYHKRRESLSREYSQGDRHNTSTLLEEQATELKSLKDELERAAAIIGDYEKMREEKSKEMQLLKLGAEASEKLKWDYELLETNFKALQYKLSGQEEDHQHRVALLNGQIAALAAELGQLRSDQGNYMKLRDEAMMETQRLQLLCTSQRGSLEALTEEMGRYKALEEKLFAEKEDLRSKYETILEEKAKLSKQCENLAKENAAITGHHNLRQRIQYHAQTKMENNKLKEEVIQLQTQLKKKTERLHHMYKVLEERDLLGSGKFVAAAQLSSQRHTENTPVESEDSIKENVAPC